MTAYAASTGEVRGSATLRELVASHPARIGLFERLRFDYCCGGERTLAQACRERGLDLDATRRLILTADATTDLPAEVETRDWARASLTELCDHIVEVHHYGLRRDLPQIRELLDSVMRVHGPVDLSLRELPAAFTRLRRELEPHLELEERVLFPACRALERSGGGASIDRAALDALEHDHHEVGEMLAQLRELTGDYDTARAQCRTHHRLIEALRSLELDVHQHVHEENNILLPRLRSLLSTSQRELPVCCRGWIAEQRHRTRCSHAR